MNKARYKFSLEGVIYYVCREEGPFVYAYSSKEDLQLLKSELTKLYFEDKVDFGCETKPDFIKPKLTTA